MGEGGAAYGPAGAEQAHPEHPQPGCRLLPLYALAAEIGRGHDEEGGHGLRTEGVLLEGLRVPVDGPAPGRQGRRWCSVGGGVASVGGARGGRQASAAAQAARAQQRRAAAPHGGAHRRPPEPPDERFRLPQLGRGASTGGSSLAAQGSARQSECMSRHVMSCHVLKGKAAKKWPRT